MAVAAKSLLTGWKGAKRLVGVISHLFSIVHEWYRRERHSCKPRPPLYSIPSDKPYANWCSLISEIINFAAFDTTYVLRFHQCIFPINRPSLPWRAWEQTSIVERARGRVSSSFSESRFSQRRWVSVLRLFIRLYSAAVSSYRCLSEKNYRSLPSDDSLFDIRWCPSRAAMAAELSLCELLNLKWDERRGW